MQHVNDSQWVGFIRDFLIYVFFGFLISFVDPKLDQL